MRFAKRFIFSVVYSPLQLVVASLAKIVQRSLKNFCCFSRFSVVSKLVSVLIFLRHFILIIISEGFNLISISKAWGLGVLGFWGLGFRV